MATTVVKTIKATGGDYTSAIAWESGTQGDLTVADEVRVGEVYGVFTGETAQIDITGATTDSTRYRILRAAAAETFSGDPHATIAELNFNRTGLLSLRLRENFAEVRGLKVSTNNPGTSDYIISGEASSCKVDRCWAHNTTRAGAGIGIASYTAGESFVVTRCLVTNTTNGLYNTAALTTPPRFVNCVCDNTIRVAGNDTITVDNCYGANFVIGSGGTMNGDYNASADTSAPGANSIHSVDPEVEFYYPRAFDFRIRGESQLLKAGADQSTYLTNDIDDETISTWMIGMDYRVWHSTKTISATGDYTTVASWEAAQNTVNFTTQDECRVGIVSGTVTESGSLIIAGGSGLSATHYLGLRAARGEEFNGDPTKSVATVQWASGGELRPNQNYFHLEGLKIHTQSSVTNALVNWYFANNGVCDRVWADVTNTGGNVFRCAQSTANNTFTRCLGTGGGTGFQTVSTSTTNKLVNCTFENKILINNSSVTLNVNNVYASTFTITAGSFAGDYNAATDTSAPGANSVDNVVTSTAFLDTASDDYRIDSGSALYQAGSDQSTDCPRDVRNHGWVGSDDTSYWAIGFDRNVVDIVKTIHATTGDYTTLKNWLANQFGDFVYYGERQVGEVSGTTTETTGNAFVEGANTDEYCYWLVKAKLGEEYSGDPAGSHATITFNVGTVGVYIDDSYTRFYGLELAQANVSGELFQPRTSNVWLDRCWANGPASGANIVSAGNNADSFLITNTLMTGGASSFRVNAISGVTTYPTLINCVSDVIRSGSSSTDMFMYNCYANNWVNPSHMNGSNNASSNTTAPGANAIHNVVEADHFVSPTTEDWHIKVSSSLRTGGIDKSEYITEDVDGETITTWMIGFDQPLVILKTGNDYLIFGVPDQDYTYAQVESTREDDTVNVLWRWISSLESTQIGDFDTLAGSTYISDSATSELQPQLTRTDTLSVSASDVYNALSSVSSRTDTLGISLSDAIAIASQLSRTDSISVSLSSLSTVLSLLSRTDSIGVSLTYVTEILSLLNRTDSADVTLVEATTNDLTSSSSDTTSASLTETSTNDLATDRTDTASASITETTTNDIATDRVDSIVTSLTETKDLLSLSQRVDTLTTSLSELTTLNSFLTRTDTLSTSVTDTIQELLSFLDRSDSLDVSISSISDVISLVTEIAASDTLSTSLTDVMEILSNLSRTDDITVSVSSITNLLSLLTRTDSIVSSLTEASTNNLFSDRTDTISTSVTETTTIQSFINRVDSIVASLTETATIFNTLVTRVDTTSLSVTETTTIASIVDTVDSIVASLTDLQTEMQYQFTQNDTTGVSTTETTSNFIESIRVDNTDISIDSVTNLLVSLAVVDTIATSLTYVTEVLVSVLALDTVTTSVTDTTNALDAYSNLTDIILSSVSEATTNNLFSNRVDSANVSAIDVTEILSLVSISDTIAVSFVDTVQELLSRLDRTDDISVSTVDQYSSILSELLLVDTISSTLSELTAIFSSSNRSDDITASLTELAIVLEAHFYSVSDTLGLSVTELTTLLSLLNRNDAITSSISEVVTLLSFVALSDNVDISLDTVTSLLVTIARSDSIDISLDSVTQLLTNIISSDTLSAQFDELVTLLGYSVLVDSGAISVDETSTGFADTQASDTVTSSVSEGLVDILSSLLSLDSVDSSVTESTQILAEQNRTDTISASVSGIVDILSSSYRNDDINVSFTEVIEILSTLLRSDISLVSISETVALFKDILLSDTISTAISDSVIDIYSKLSRQDDIDISVTGFNSILVFLLREDSADISLSYVASILSTLERSDDLNVSVSELVYLFKDILITDSIDIGLVSSVVELLNMFSAQDTTLVSMSSVVQNLQSFISRSDSLDISVQDIADLIAAIVSNDSLAISISDVVAITNNLLASDTINLQVVDTFSDIIGAVYVSDDIDLALSAVVSIFGDVNTFDSVVTALTEYGDRVAFIADGKVVELDDTWRFYPDVDTWIKERDPGMWVSRDVSVNRLWRFDSVNNKWVVDEKDKVWILVKENGIWKVL